jgi:hypothetical protein
MAKAVHMLGERGFQLECCVIGSDGDCVGHA